jgi:hypothetical protein
MLHAQRDAFAYNKDFVTSLFFTVKGCEPHVQPESWRTTPCRLSAAAYSVYLQLPIAGGRYSIRNSRTRHAVGTGTHPPNMVSKLREKNVVVSPVGLGPEDGCNGEGQQELQTPDLSFRQRRRPTSTNSKLTVIQIWSWGPRWVPDTRTD